MPSDLDRYERIAPLYDLPDLLSSIAATVRYDPCCSRGSGVGYWMQASVLVEILRTIHRRLRLSASTSAPPCLPAQSVDAFHSAPRLSCIRWTYPISHLQITTLMEP